MNFDSIHNYYEPLVIDHVMNTLAKEGGYNETSLEDIVCLTLNQLPPRYVRHDADMALFLSTREREKMQRRITEAVLNAATTVNAQRHNSE